MVAVYFWGVEPARRSLEGFDPKTAWRRRRKWA